MTIPDVRVVFTIEEEGYPSYTDALYVPLLDYDKLAESGELERMQRERYDAWREQFDNPVPAEPVVVTQEDALATARQALTDAMAAIDAVTADPVVIDQEP